MLGVTERNNEKGKAVPEKPKRRKKQELVGLLGVGFDNKDGHHRLTRGQNFFLIGGSQPTHDRMLETAIRFNEKLKKRRKRLMDLSHDELVDLFEETGPESD